MIKRIKNNWTKLTRFEKVCAVVGFIILTPVLTLPVLMWYGLGLLLDGGES